MRNLSTEGHGLIQKLTFTEKSENKLLESALPSLPVDDRAVDLSIPNEYLDGKQVQSTIGQHLNTLRVIVHVGLWPVDITTAVSVEADTPCSD